MLGQNFKIYIDLIPVIFLLITNMLIRSFLPLIFVINLALAQAEVKKIDLKGLERLLSDNSQEYHVINFWATWCAPCIEELPYFQKIQKEYKKKKVKFSFISMDFNPNVVSPFLTKKRYNDFDVYLMTDLDYNKWINLVDQEWEGEIPATLFISNRDQKRFFKADSYDEKNLRRAIQKLIN